MVTFSTDIWVPGLTGQQPQPCSKCNNSIKYVTLSTLSRSSLSRGLSSVGMGGVWGTAEDDEDDEQTEVKVKKASKSEKILVAENGVVDPKHSKKKLKRSGLFVKLFHLDSSRNSSSLPDSEEDSASSLSPGKLSSALASASELPTPSSASSTASTPDLLAKSAESNISLELRPRSSPQPHSLIHDPLTTMFELASIDSGSPEIRSTPSPDYSHASDAETTLTSVSPPPMQPLPPPIQKLPDYHLSSASSIISASFDCPESPLPPPFFEGGPASGPLAAPHPLETIADEEVNNRDKKPDVEEKRSLFASLLSPRPRRFQSSSSISSLSKTLSPKKKSFSLSNCSNGASNSVSSSPVSPPSKPTTPNETPTLKKYGVSDRVIGRGATACVRLVYCVATEDDKKTQVWAVKVCF